MKPNNKDKVECKAWVGQWSSGFIGWLLPFCIDGRDERPDFHQFKTAGKCAEPITLYRCKITVERLRDSRGRPITRRIGGKQ